MGVSGLFGVDADGGPSRVVQPPLLKLDVDVVGGGTVVAWDGSGGGGGGGGPGFGGFETVVHPGFLKPPPEDELLTVDQPPTVNPDFFSGGAGPGSVPGVAVITAESLMVLIMPTTGVAVLSFTPAALAAFCNSFSSLFRSFSLRFSFSSWELALARSLNCISLNRIL